MSCCYRSAKLELQDRVLSMVELLGVLFWHGLTGFRACVKGRRLERF